MHTRTLPQHNGRIEHTQTNTVHQLETDSLPVRGVGEGGEVGGPNELMFKSVLKSQVTEPDHSFTVGH